MNSAVVNFVAGKEQRRRKPLDFQGSATMSSGEILPARPKQKGLVMSRPPKANQCSKGPPVLACACFTLFERVMTNRIHHINES